MLATLWRRYAAMLGVFLLAGGAIAWLVWPRPKPLQIKPPPPELKVAGESLPLGDPVANALDLVRRYAREELTLQLPDGRTHTLRPVLLGAVIDRARVGEAVRAALVQDLAPDPSGLIVRRVVDLPLPIRIDTSKATDALVALKDSFDSAPIEAHVDLGKRELVPEKWGYRLDVYGTLARIDAALVRGEREIEAEVHKVKPRVLADQLGEIDFSDVLGYFETRYSRGARSRARTYNLRQAASRLDGTVLLPGEEFDFNRVVGPRDEANGYKVAPVIAQGELVDGIGGGTCQISGTLHGAAFFAGLNILERRPHTRPSYYIKLGMDAAVAYPTINFKLHNPFDHPVVLHETVKGGVVRAEILGPKRVRTVTFFRRIDRVLPFEEVERETEKLAEGERELSQRGIPGFRATVFRIVRSGVYAERTKRRDVYPPTTQIVWVGTGPADTKPNVKSDSHPEYVADEYLVMTQGPKIRTPGVKGEEPGGGMVESRVAGRTGRYGWQEREGLSVFNKVEQDDDEDMQDEDMKAE